MLRIPEFTNLFPVWYVTIISGCVSYRKEANEFWMRIIQGRGQWILDTYHRGKRSVNYGYVAYRDEASDIWFTGLFPVWYVSRMYWPLPCMIPIQNSLASSLYDTHPEFIGLIPVCYARPVNSGYVSYREEANALWIRIIQGRGQWIMDTYHTGKRPMISGYVSCREEASEL
jgi:hypothetical protein